MPVVEFVLVILARDLDLLDIRHDDVVANVAGRLEDGLVLPAQQRRDLRSEPPEDLALCVDKVPSTPDLCEGLILGRSRLALREWTESAPGRLDRAGAGTAYSKTRFIRTPTIRTQASRLRSAKNPLQASTGCPKHTR